MQKIEELFLSVEMIKLRMDQRMAIAQAKSASPSSREIEDLLGRSL